MKYQLPCSCGKSIPIEVSQAGQVVSCSCGAQLDVPTLRLLRQLKPVAATAAVQARPVRNWSAASRILFALGLAVAAFGLWRAAYYQWGRSSLDTEAVAWDYTLDANISQLSNMNLDDAWKNWEQVRESGIGPFRPPPFVMSRMISAHLKKTVVTGLWIALGGFVAAGAALLLPRETAGQRVRRK